MYLNLTCLVQFCKTSKFLRSMIDFKHNSSWVHKDRHTDDIARHSNCVRNPKNTPKYNKCSLQRACIVNKAWRKYKSLFIVNVRESWAKSAGIARITIFHDADFMCFFLLLFFFIHFSLASKYVLEDYLLNYLCVFFLSLLRTYSGNQESVSIIIFVWKVW